jgi:hypothetical protein
VCFAFSSSPASNKFSKLIYGLFPSSRVTVFQPSESDVYPLFFGLEITTMRKTEGSTGMNEVGKGDPLP